MSSTTLSTAGLTCANMEDQRCWATEFLQSGYQVAAMALEEQQVDVHGPHRMTSNIDRDDLGDKIVYFPNVVWVFWAVFILVVVFHEIYVSRGGRPILAHPIPQKSLGIQVIALWGWASGFINMSMQVPLSLDYTIAMGMDPTLSGIVVSLTGFSGLIGAVIGKKICPEENWNQRYARRLMIWIPLCMTWLSILQMWVGQWVGSQSIPTRRKWFWILLGLGQIGAVTGGMTALPGGVIWNKCTLQKDKTFWMMLAQAAKQIGLAVGPGFAALMIWMVQGNGSRVSPISMTAWLSLFMAYLGGISSLLSIFTCPTYIPELQEDLAEDASNAASQDKLEPAPEDLCPADREKLVWAMLWYSFERPLTLGSVEVATVMLLEVEYDWSREETGIVFTLLATMGTFLSLFSAWGLQRKLFSESKVLLWGGIAGLIGSFLLFDWHSSLGLTTLLIADPLIYGAALTSCGIAEGWAARAAMPGTTFSFDNYRVRDVMLNTLSRMIAPTLARVLVDLGGRNCYAALQTIAVTLAFRSLLKACALVWNHDGSKKQDQFQQPKKEDDVPNKVSEPQEASPELSQQVKKPLTGPIAWSSWTPRILPGTANAKLQPNKLSDPVDQDDSSAAPPTPGLQTAGEGGEMAPESS